MNLVPSSYYDSRAEIASFGPFDLNPRARALYRSGIPVALGSRALDILIALVERAGEVVDQRELLSRAWRGLSVESGNVRVQMTYLRRCLGDGRDGARYIANVPAQGYCFVAAVKHVESQDRTPAVGPDRGIVGSFATAECRLE